MVRFLFKVNTSQITEYQHLNPRYTRVDIHNGVVIVRLDFHGYITNSSVDSAFNERITAFTACYECS